MELVVTKLTNEGTGLGRVDVGPVEGEAAEGGVRGGWVVLVPFTLPGERVRVRVYRNHRNYSEADLVEVLEPSPERREPACPLFGRCGGCQYQHLSYAGQLEWKRRQVEELLRHLAGVESAVAPVVPSPREWGYRSKITPHFNAPRPDRPWPIGFLRAGSRHDIVDVPACPLASEPLNRALVAVRAEVMADRARWKRGATLLLRENADGTVTTDPTAVARARVGGLELEFPAGDFFQNNPHLLEAFVAHVADRAGGAGVRCLIDTYCGSGLFALTAARRFERVAGVEVSEPAVERARGNAERNGLGHVEFLCADASAIFAKVDYAPAETAVILDPPRKGSDAAFLAQLVAYGPARVVYVSCNPATQMRDLVSLRAGGYELEGVQPFDLFPQTRHLECVMSLRRAGERGGGR